MKRVLLLVVALVAASLGLTGTAGAGGGPWLAVDLVSPVEPLRFRVEVVGVSCSSPITILGVKTALYDDPLDVLDVTPLALVPGPGNNVVTLVLPSDTRPGTLVVDAQCLDEEDDTVRLEGAMPFASIAVTKVVAGSPPEGTTFTVQLDCVDSIDGDGEVDLRSLPDDFVAEVTFGAGGGLKYVYSDHPVICTVTEPGTGGATSVTISPEVLDLTPAPTTYATTVTNTFPAAPEPAPAIAVTPRFTG